LTILNIFSKRQKRNRGEVPDVFTYDAFSPQLRTQIVHIIKDSLGVPQNYNGYEVPWAYGEICRVLCREYGVFSLTQDEKPRIQLLTFVVREPNVERVLDVVELVARALKMLGPITHTYGEEPRISGDEAIEEFNQRFLEHGVGYRIESGTIVRIDSELLHQDAVKPALAAISNKVFQGANEELLKAFEHYRQGNYKECLNECLKAVESTIKIICKKRKWVFKPTDTAKNLLEICFSEGLVPSYLQSHATALRSCLESGVPTVRNKLSGHGQGSDPVTVPDYYARYMLHQSSSIILFLVDADKALK
jgi:hypothetical protein